MGRNDETLLDTAVQALQAAQPDSNQLEASTMRLAARLGIDGMGNSVVDAIDNCDDVQRLLTPYRAGTLSNSRSLLIEAHMRECGICHRHLRAGSGAATLDWSAPRATRAFVWRPQAFGWALAAGLAIFVSSFFLYKAYWQIPPGVRAEVESIDGSAYRISEGGDRQLAPGDKLTQGESIRTSGGAHAVLRLTDGSTVEVNERSVLGVGARGHNLTISLDRGAVIVQATKRDSGHLYLKTPDCRVAVTGTLFSVDSGIKGSRVGVLQGSVHVEHGGVDTLVHAGDQVATNDNLSPEPLDQQIAWSHDSDKYFVLMAQFDALQRRIEQIPSPQLRYTSDLLARVPADTLLYISIPNFGDFLSEANNIFQDQLKQSSALQQWWDHGHDADSAELSSLVEKLHEMSQYLGNEIVVVGLKQANDPGFAVIADVQKSGLAGFLRNEFPSSGSTPGITVFDETSLAAAPASSNTKDGGYALIRSHEVVFSNSIATLKQVNAQLNAGASGFAASSFGQQIEAAYGRGAGVILAADLHQMAGDQFKLLRAGHADALENSGADGVEYLIAEHREMNGQPENHLNLQFSGTRQRVASWLAAPAPIGSLDFVTPNAAIATAFLSKDPKAIADDILAMADPDKDKQSHGLSDAEAKLGINLRDDIAANLGGDFLVSLDGPVLPTPAWKAVIEVNDADRLEMTLERLTQAIQAQAQGKSHGVAIESSEVGGQRFYSVRDLTSGNTFAEYAFADGFMIVAPNRALVMEALHAHTSGDSLARSAAFKALLPKDENENYSAIAYQNLSPELNPLLSRFSGSSADALRQIAADARPTVVCAWGKESRIEVASDSHLFGFDFLALEALINPGNNHTGTSVKE
jgi:hypothetical protein